MVKLDDDTAAKFIFTIIIESFGGGGGVFVLLLTMRFVCFSKCGWCVVFAVLCQHTQNQRVLFRFFLRRLGFRVFFFWSAFCKTKTTEEEDDIDHSLSFVIEATKERASSSPSSSVVVFFDDCFETYCCRTKTFLLAERKRFCWIHRKREREKKKEYIGDKNGGFFFHVS